MSILPSKKPVIKETSFAKVCRYFFGANWMKLYPIVELAIRHPRIQFYDDELAVWTKVLNGIKTFNWNADPSAYLIRNEPKAILRKGVHFFKLSYHKIADNSKRYVALRPATPGERLLVWRRDAKGNLTPSVGVAINQHKGGADSTWSEGCQTAHFSQYPEFIQTIGDVFGIKIPLGVVKKPDARLLKGVGNFPYILIDQKDFNYIVNLPESEFDSPADLIYQAKNFVGIPKIEPVAPQNPFIPNANAILAAVEIEAAENIFLVQQIPELPAVGNVSQQSAAIPGSMSVTDDTGELSGNRETDDVVPNAPEDSDENSFAAFIPQINTARKYLTRLFAGTVISTALAPFVGLPIWLQISLVALVITIVIVGGIIFARYYKQVFAFVTEMNKLRATKGIGNPIVTSKKH